MKITVTQEKKEFKPFILSLEIENEDELRQLHNRFNVSVRAQQKDLGTKYKENSADIDNMISIFEILDDKLSNDD